MCLVTTQLEPKIADKDIICYKLVERTKIKGVYKSKYQGFEYVIRQLYTNNLDIRFANKSIKRYFYTGFYINKTFEYYPETFIVTFNSEEAAKKAIDILGDELNVLFK